MAKRKHSIAKTPVNLRGPVEAGAGPGIVSKYWPLAVIIVLASVLLLVNLGGQALWQDEAQTAVTAGTIVHHGIPLGYDGRNNFSQEEGADYGKNGIWRWHAWLQFYVLVPFLVVMGKTTLAARLPFALFGIGAVIMTYLTASLCWKSRRAAVLCSLLLTASVPFLLLARQCRYYSPAAFFSLLAIYGYIMLLENRKRGAAVFVIGSLFLFHSHYAYCGALLAAAVIHSLLFCRRRAIQVLIWSALVTALGIPWMIWVYHTSLGQAGSAAPAGNQIASAKLYLEQMGRYVFPPIFLALAVVAYAIRRFRGRAPGGLDKTRLSYAALFVLFVAVSVAALSVGTPFPFFRYLAPLIPFCCLIGGWILDECGLAIGVVTLALFVLLPPNYWMDLVRSREDFTAMEIEQPVLSNYWYEATHEFRGPIDGIVKYLKEHGKDSDVVGITYGDMPLKFYTNMRIVGGLTGEDLSPMKNAEWIIARKYPSATPACASTSYMQDHIDVSEYERIELDYPDTGFENREDPAEHRYRTAVGENPVVIYHRVR